MSEIKRSDVGDDTILQSSCSVMVKTSVLISQVTFRNVDWKAPAKDQDKYRKMVLDTEDWEEMGRPYKITVTVEPGDLLNTQIEGE